MTARGVLSGEQRQRAPLTHSQESLYFLHGLTRGQPVYHMPMAFRVRGELNQSAFSKALQFLLHRHAALRTCILESEDGPVQVVQANPELPLIVQAVSHSNDTTADELARRVQESITRPFNLAGELPFRVTLFQLAPSEHILLLNLHHIAGDMTSLGILCRELEIAYNSILAGESPVLSENPAQFTDYALAQRQQSVNPETLAFWKKRLDGFLDELDFPTDFKRSALPSFSGAVHSFTIDRELCAKLKLLARSHQCSMQMLCMATLSVLACRHSHQEKFTIGTPFSLRVDLELESTIGYLINLLPIPFDLSGDLTFAESLARVRQASLESYMHHEVSFRQILRGLGISSEDPKPALTRLVFQYFSGPTATIALDGLESEPFPVHSGTSKFDLCFTFAEESGGIAASVEFDSELFQRSTVERLCRHFTRLFKSALDNPFGRIRELPMMDETELKLIESWNETGTGYPRDKTVDQLFEEQARATPDSTALAFQEQRLTYRELLGRVNQIAGCLISRGIKPGDKVGVCIERSPDLIASLLAILKCGAIYVPIDASYPLSRINFMCADADLALVLTNKAPAATMPAALPKLLIDEVASAPANFRSEEPSGRSAGQPAYIMYTSGSTGSPKGVIVPHRAIVRLVKGSQFARFSPDETFLAFAPISFDASTLEIWGPLLNGGILALYPPVFESLEQFEETLTRHKVTTLWLTSGLFNTIIDRKPAALSAIRQLLIGGDVLSVAHVAKAQDLLPSTRIINGYGPTENTTFTCCYSIPRNLDASRCRSIPIGRPISNTRVFIFDDDLQLAPIGVPGTLYAGGDGLSLGYQNQPELTRQVFVRNPLPNGRDEILYNTGDRARWLEDGNIEFLGRQDSQVKIRGFRIELGEIEGALRSLPEVLDAAALVREDANYGKSIVAYITGRPGANLDPAQIHEQLKSILPAFSRPSKIIPIDALPLGHNGKVDRKKLAALESPGIAAAKPEFVAPSSDAEEKIAIVWSDLLGIRSPSVTDSFFQLGGDSLLAMRAISRMNRILGCKLTLSRLFENPTIRALSRLAQSSSQKSALQKNENSVDPGVISNGMEVDKMTDAEVDILLTQLLTANE
jgi:amino acid adenylation domain-containing protein